MPSVNNTGTIVNNIIHVIINLLVRYTRYTGLLPIPFFFLSYQLFVIGHCMTLGLPQFEHLTSDGGPDMRSSVMELYG